jgi:hypothetical protein
MTLRLTAEPAWVARGLMPARIRRGLALAVAVMTAAALVFAVVGLVRELRLDRVTGWLCVTGLVVVGVVALGYGGWLARRLRRNGWRLSPTESGRLVAGTVLVFWTAGGFASYAHPAEWALSGATAVLVAAVVVPFLLRRLSERDGVTDTP